MRFRDNFRRGPRPPWWPAGEPWPPSRPPWHRIPGRLFLRVGCLIGLFFVLIFAALAAIFWLVAQTLGIVSIPPGAFVWVGPLAVLALVVVVGSIVSTMRALRRAVTRIGDLLEAAGRLADGDYTARVAERGPREVRAVAHAFNAMAGRLQASAEQRRNLLADVTHELRTPLTIIQGNLEGLLDGVYPADEEHLRLILAETQTLSRLVDDLRTLALAESGALQLKKEPTDLALLARETAASFRAQADAAGVAIRVEAPPDLPAAEVDPARIREALANLIANALRYTPSGASITVRCAAESVDGVRRVALAVEDTGRGIAAEDLPHIFDRFYKSGDSGGMGLGLAITKNLIAAHGGEISTHSQPGQGTTIRFTLPAGL